MVSISTGDENLKFIRACMDNQVEFLLIGGVAVRFYGCRDTDTFDEIDILIERSRENAERLMAALRQVGRRPEFTADQLQQPNTQILLKYAHLGYNLDILTPWKEWSYSDFRGCAQVITLGPLKVWVVSKPDLITMKKAVVSFLDSEAERFPDRSEMLQSQAEKHRKDLRCLKGQSGI